ncbi:fatty-acid--CoA ligase [Desulfocarbo indianensis]|nr:fatty-acid--CoA ligase [Desulfocarbo indianensis]
MNLVDLLQRNAHKFADRPFLSHGGQGVTYAQAAQAAARATGLMQSWGIAKGDRVAIMSLNTPAFVYAFFGAQLAGAAVVPINHKLAAPEVDYILAHSEAKLFLFDGALAPVAQTLAFAGRKASLDSAAPGYEHFAALLAGAPQPQAVQVSDQDLAEILYTSGTTGKPKGCLHTQQTVVMAGITGAMVMKMDSQDRLLMAMPIWHSSPLNNWFMGAFYVGASIVLLREYHPLEFLRAVQDEKCTIYFGAPISYLAPLQMVPNFAEFDLSSMRCWIYGGGPIAADVAKKLMAAYQSDRFYQVYGMTEAGPTGTTLFPDEQIAYAGSIGRTALPGADIKVVTGEGAEAKPGETGEIWVKADSMMKGYLKDPAASQAAFSEGWYKTGDVARLDQDGYLFIVDRTKDMIITGGENVYSKEVEDALAAHPQVMEAAVIGRPHAEWGETVVALVVPAKDAGLSEEALKEHLAGRLAKYKIPREFKLVEALPHTPTGKIMKYKLREDI